MHFKKKRKEALDCSKCLPEVMPENEDAVEVYSRVHGQAIYVGMDAVAVDLDFNAVKFIMDLTGVEKQLDCFNRVCMMWHHANNLKRKAGK